MTYTEAPSSQPEVHSTTPTSRARTVRRAVNAAALVPVCALLLACVPPASPAPAPSTGNVPECPRSGTC
jgi:hypothetical protein